MADVKTADSPHVQTELNQTAFVILGMLSHGYPLSGYEMRQWCRRSLGSFYKPPAQSQIYRELISLEEHALVTSQVVAGTDAPDKTVFALTVTGRAALEEWIIEGRTAEMVLKHPLAMQTSFAAGIEPTSLIERIDEHIESTMSMLHELEDLVIGLEDDSGSALARASLEWAIEIRRADISGAERAKATLIEARG